MGRMVSNSKQPSRFSSTRIFIPRYFIITGFIFLTVIFIFEVDDFVSRTKTMVGHNLEPTPWHVFPQKPFEYESKLSLALKIVRCNYLGCGLTGDSTTTTYNKHRYHNQSNNAQSENICPILFRNIHHDLEPWKQSKISPAYLIEAQKFAAFRIVIVSGKLYVDFYYACVQSRAMFTIWSFLQLLKRYPGMIPDVDMMFDCMDKPTIEHNEHAAMPLPLFRYCTTPQHFDIPFPDWSFWGWSEIHIEEWDKQFRSIKQGSLAQSWNDKSPLAYWKGNPEVASPLRLELLQCNDTTKWRAEILRQNWEEETKKGFKESKLSNQCNHRYKIYAEGYAWSVSLKYILSCGSVPLIITPEYQDFLSRGLIAKKHYLPIPREEMCRFIKLAVNWGNAHTNQAEAIGKSAQQLMETMNMGRVYDYMYHLITEYSKLMDFMPVPPSSAIEICEGSVLCFANENQREFLEMSSTYPSRIPPCLLQL